MKPTLRIATVVLLFCVIGYAQEIRRPTAEANDATAGACTGATHQATVAMPNFYDAGGASTSSTQTVSTSNSTYVQKQRIFTTWQAATAPYSSLSLIITPGCSSTGTVGDSHCGVQYSLNGGGSWTSSASTVTSTITLPADQDLSQLQVRGCVDAVAEGTGAVRTGTLTGYDIRTEGVIGGKHRSQVISTE